MTAPEAVRNEQFEALLEYLKRSRGFDFTAYKRTSLVRRVEKRMQMAGIESYSDYSELLEANPQEFTELFDTILINVTSFFRDPEMWEYIRSDVIPRIVQLVPSGPIRLWSAGCSTGEEAYGLAIHFAETLGHDEFRERVKIYATDVDEDALAQGRQATYSESAISAVPAEMVPKYFERSNGTFTFNRDLRRSIIFGRHDLILDPPISHVALLVCRNTLMYFNSEVQQRILSRFHFGLIDHGFLFLGKAEMLLTRSTVFSPVDLKKRIFAKLPRLLLRNGGTMAPPRDHDEQEGANAADRLRELALHTDPTAQVVLDQANVVLLANERARTLFGLTARDIGRTLQDLELSYRPTDLRSIIDQVTAERRLIIVKDIDWTTHAGERMFLDVQVMPLLTASSDILGVKVLFRDVTRYRRLEDELKGSHHALETVNEELQSTNEELETTNEELQSTVEELETTNEELQSTNEELETMNEELQSTNEELQTANDQLRHSGEELNRANAFLENLLSSFDDGVAVVDSELRVRAWNSKAEDLWGVRSIEVQGKHLMNLDIGLPVESLLAALRQILSGGSAFERLTVVATNRRGRTIDLEVSCMPLAVSRNPTWGAILTMEDKTSARSPLTPSTTH